MESDAPVEVFRGTSRAWVFTWNNYPVEAFDILSARRVEFSACFVGKEVGASGTPHLQGVIISKKPCRLAHLVRLFPGVHFEPMRGSEAQAVEYTKKEGNPDRLDWDDRAQGSRTDLAAVCAVIKANPRTGPREVALTMPTAFVKYHAGVTALARVSVPVPPLIVQRHVKWFFGPTGTGKSWTALREAVEAAGGDESDVYRWSNHNLKFAGVYAGERYVVIDELRPDWEHFTFARLLSLLDCYRQEVEVKNGQTWWGATHVWITTTLHPQDFVTDQERRGNPEAVAQLNRRIHSVGHFTERYVAPSDAPAPAPSSQPPAPSSPAAPVGTPPLRVLPPTQIASDSEPDPVPLLRRNTIRVRNRELVSDPIVSDSEDPAIARYFARQ